MATKLISIDPEKRNDPDQRYKMQEPLITNQGKGCHGKSTVFSNINKIAESLSVPKEILAKLLAKSLNTSYDEKNNSFSGSFTKNKIKKHIDEFICEIVLCLQCRSPELSKPDIQKIGKKEKNWIINFKCNGCGNTIKKFNDTFSSKIIIKYLEKSKNNWIIKKGNSVQMDSFKLNDLTFEI